MYMGLTFILAQNIIFFSFFERKKLKKWLWGQFLVALLLLPWLHKTVYSVIDAAQIAGWIPQVNNYFKLFFYSIFIKAITGVFRNNLIIDVIEPAVYCFLIIWGFIGLNNAGRKRHALIFTRGDFLLATWIIAPIVAFLVFNAAVTTLLSEATPRYVGFVHIPLIILACKGIIKYKVKFQAVLLTALLMMIFIFHLHPLYQYDYRVHNDNWRLLFNQLHQRAAGDALILTRLPRHKINYYNKGYEMRLLPKDADIINGPDFSRGFNSVFVIYRFKDSVDKDLLEQEMRGYRLKEDYFNDPIGFLWFKKNEREQDK